MPRQPGRSPYNRKATAMALTAQEVPEGRSPHRAFGTGKVIRAGRYGHVEVTAVPRMNATEIVVEWRVPGRSIPEALREPILVAARRMLMSAAANGRLRGGVLLIIENGSYHDEMSSAHIEAAELAITDALRRGAFTRAA